MRTTLTLAAFTAALVLGFSFAQAADTSVPGATNSTPSAESKGNPITPPDTTAQDEDSGAAQSAKMGNAEGTQSGEANQGTSENETKKIEQPPRQNQTTGQ
jgi:hypothetical protein